MEDRLARILDGKPDFVRDALALFTRCINADSLLDLAKRDSDTFTKLARDSTDHFLLTPVTALPTGKEKGRFLSIDVGGTNLRVGFIELLGELDASNDTLPNGNSHGDSRHTNGVATPQTKTKTKTKIKSSYVRSWAIEEHLKNDQAEDLFSWIGDCMAEVITAALNDTDHPNDVHAAFGDELLLGITFSFPMKQTCLSEATLLPMGKGFAITSNLDLKKMLLAGYARHINGTDGSPSLPRIRLAAITNDTVATFASLAYAVKAAPNSRVAMGLIVGTGTNATVPMPPSALHASKLADLPTTKDLHSIVINTEWTIRGTDAPLIALGLKTKWDLQLDAQSELPGFQPFEYMTAGRYLGEIVRLVFVDLADQELLQTRLDAGGGTWTNRDMGAGSQFPPSLRGKNALPTRFLSEVLASELDTAACARHLECAYPSTTHSEGSRANPTADMETSFWTTPRVQVLRDVAFAVQQRSSALIAAACVGLLDCVGDVHIERVGDERTPGEGESVEEGGGEGEELVIAYAGGTISNYPLWLSTCQHWIDELVARASPGSARKRVVLREALDGGLWGAGVLAGMMGESAMV